MSTRSPKTPQTNQLEDSKLWQLADKVTTQTRESVRLVPYNDQYVLAGPAIQNATLVCSDLAYAYGKLTDATASDYRYARGRLFTVKSLLLQIQELNYVQMKSLLADIDKLCAMIDKEIVQLEAAEAKAEDRKVKGKTDK